MQTAFQTDLQALRRDLDQRRGVADIAWFRRVEALAWAFFLLGLGLSAFGLNLLAPLLLALASSTRWMVLAHHLCHGALDGLPGVPQRFSSRGFARGWRRWLQWPDWIEPQAWRREHNQLHHAYTNEGADPDLVQRQLAWLRASTLPLPARYAMVGLFACTWRWLYYAPSTTACMADPTLQRREAGALHESAVQLQIWSPLNASGRRLWLHSWLAYPLFQFGAVPLLLLPFGVGAWQAALIHVLVAEILTSIHTFVVIVPNHAGDDLVRFDDRARNKADWSLRQIAASCNYRTGSDLNDLLHGWLNYQIEHHIWPNLTPRQYQWAAPRLREICQRHGVQYVQDSIWRRARKMAAIMVGTETMRSRSIPASTVAKPPRLASAPLAHAAPAQQP